MLEIGSILEKFNTINSQLIQYWWYWFCTISVGCIGIQNIQMLFYVLQQEIKGNCGGSIAVPIYWLIYIAIIIIVILPITGFLHLAQQWFLPAKELLIFDNTILLQKILSCIFLLIHLASTLVVISFFAYFILRK